MIHFLFFSEAVNFGKWALMKIDHEMKLLSYSLDSLTRIVTEMNSSQISSNSVQQCNSINIQELKWPITNMAQLADNEKLLTDTLIKNNEVCDSYVFIYNKK